MLPDTGDCSAPLFKDVSYNMMAQTMANKHASDPKMHYVTENSVHNPLNFKFFFSALIPFTHLNKENKKTFLTKSKPIILCLTCNFRKTFTEEGPSCHRIA